MTENAFDKQNFGGLGQRQKQSLRYFRYEIQPGDVVVGSGGTKSFRAIGIVADDEKYYYDSNVVDFPHSLRVDWHFVSDQPVQAAAVFRRNFSGFHTIYQLYDLPRQRLVDWLTGLGTDESQNPQPFVLIIDEINRGNISRILGELISLIEPSRRIGRDEQLRVKLPHSRESFGVPPNLYLIGTMNTADRSIASVDSTLSN